MLGQYELNKIYCEDCYEAIKKIPDKSVDLIVTDPPYDIRNTKAGGQSALAKSFQQMNDELRNNKLTHSINFKILDEFVRILKKINIYIWCNTMQIPKYLEYFVGKHKCKFEIIIWRKTNAVPTFSNKYLTDKEYCLYFRKGHADQKSVLPACWRWRLGLHPLHLLFFWQRRQYWRMS